jgi:hypothetical protein
MSLHRLIALTTFVTLTACGQAEDTETTTTSSTTTATTTTTTTPPTGSALKAHIGLAITDVVNTGGATEWDGISYAGTESERYEDDKENILCEVTYDLNQIAENTTCDACWWAFDLELSNAAITAELENYCATILGVDAATVGDLFNGTTKSYGYNGDWYGHATVLFALEDENWDGVSFGYYIDKTGEFSYQREFGQIDY